MYKSIIQLTHSHSNSGSKDQGPWSTQSVIAWSLCWKPSIGCLISHTKNRRSTCILNHLHTKTSPTVICEQSCIPLLSSYCTVWKQSLHFSTRFRGAFLLTRYPPSEKGTPRSCSILWWGSLLFIFWGQSPCWWVEDVMWKVGVDENKTSQAPFLCIARHPHCFSALKVGGSLWTYVVLIWKRWIVSSPSVWVYVSFSSKYHASFSKGGASAINGCYRWPCQIFSHPWDPGPREWKSLLARRRPSKSRSHDAMRAVGYNYAGLASRRRAFPSRDSVIGRFVSRSCSEREHRKKEEGGFFTIASRLGICIYVCTHACAQPQVIHYDFSLIFNNYCFWID